MSQEKTPIPSPATNLNVNNLKDLKDAKTEAELKQELTMLKTQVSELMKEIKESVKKVLNTLAIKSKENSNNIPRRQQTKYVMRSM